MKKIPIIPPILIEDHFVTDIQTKANIFKHLKATAAYLQQTKRF